MALKTPKARHLRRFSKPWEAVRLEDLREHAVWAVDLNRKENGLWICPLVAELSLNSLFFDYYAPVFVKAVFEFADGTYPRGLICLVEDADDLNLDPAVFGVDGTLVNLVVREHRGEGIERTCERLGRRMDQVMPLRMAATVECGRKLVCERRMPGFPVAVRDRRMPRWMQDGVRYVGPEVG